MPAGTRAALWAGGGGGQEVQKLAADTSSESSSFETQGKGAGKVLIHLEEDRGGPPGGKEIETVGQVPAPCGECSQGLPQTYAKKMRQGGKGRHRMKERDNELGRKLSAFLWEAVK